MSSDGSTWAKLIALPPGHDSTERIRCLYGEYFTFEARSALGHWVEEQPWHVIDPNNRQHDGYAHQLVLTLVTELQRVATMVQDESLRSRLEQVASVCHAKFANDPTNLVAIIQTCLNGEKQVIQEHGNTWSQMGTSFSQIHISGADLTARFKLVTLRTRECEIELSQLKEDQEELLLMWQESSHWTSVINELQNPNPLQQRNGEVTKASPNMIAKLIADSQKMDAQLNVRGQNMAVARRTWIGKQIENLEAISHLQQTVLDDELIKWKHSQQLAGNGGVLNGNLDHIQEWSETLAELIWRNREQVQTIEFLCAQLFLESTDSIAEQIAANMAQTTDLLSSLINGSFIIEKQPPQVMKTNTRFSSVVRLLVGGKLNVHLTRPKVSVELLSEAQAKKFYNNEPYEKSGEITLNSEGKMELFTSNMYQTDMAVAPGQMIVNFRNMKLLNRGLKRAEKKGNDVVMDEKFGLLYRTHFSIVDLNFSVSVLSLPVIIISHTDQTPNSTATIIWDNAFAIHPRVPFTVSGSEPWHRIVEMLSLKFKSVVGCDLSKESLNFLAGKAFRNTNFANYDHRELTWSQFCKDLLPGCNFTFWGWFYAVLKTIQNKDPKSKDKEGKAIEKSAHNQEKHLKDICKDGNLMGFIGRQDAEKLLLNCTVGTFLLRFSDSELGGIGVAWVGENCESNREVFMLQPFTSKNLAVRSLADCINDLKNIHYLYPNIPKDEAFGKYYTNVDSNHKTSNGYVKPGLSVHIPGMNTGLGSISNSPQSEPGSPQYGATSPQWFPPSPVMDQDEIAASLQSTFTEAERALLAQVCEELSVEIEPMNECYNLLK